MARIRTIKPEFFSSEDIVSLSPLARLLYVALWCEADKEGRFVWKPGTFKLRYLPADNVNIESLCGELLARGLVKRYGDAFAYVPKFNAHQHVNPRESSSIIPAPPGVSESGPKKVGKTLREAVFERDGHACVRCGSTERIECDHILPVSCGGPHIMENLRTLCKTCNAARPVAGKALEEDLAKDGFTVKSLRAKFGIDASIFDVDAQVGKERKGKEGNSDPVGSGAAAPASVPDVPSDPPSDRDMVFANGVPLLMAAAVTEKNARSFLAAQSKAHGDAKLLDALMRCAKERPIQPIPWLQATLGTGKTSKHSGFASKDYRQGIAEDGTFS